MFQALASVLYRHPRRTLVAAGIFVAVCGVLGGPVAGKLSTSNASFEDASSASVKTRELIEQRSGVSPDIAVVVLVRAGADVHSPAVRARIGRIAKSVAADPGVARVFDLYSTGDRSFASTDGRSTYLAVAFKPLPAAEHDTVAKRLEKLLENEPGVTVGGAAPLRHLHDRFGLAEAPSDLPATQE